MNKNPKSSNDQKSKRRSGKRWNNKSNKNSIKKYTSKMHKDEEEVVTDNTGRMNDPTWYGGGALRDSVASLFFSHPAGLPLQMLKPGFESDIGLTSTQYDFAQAGILSLDIVPTFGPSTGKQAPINIAAQAMWAFLREKNSGARNTDPNDVMTYVLAVAEAFSCVTHLMRIYGVIRRYSAVNRYMPEALCHAMDVDYSSVASNPLEFAAGINLLVSKLGAFAVPSNIDYFKRKVFMYRDIYIDSENPKDQIYLFNPKGFYKYTFDSLRPEAYLKWSQWPANATVSQMITYANNLIDELWTSEDAALICGDIIKAYGANILQLPMLPLDYIVSPVVMDDYLRFQIRNATIVNEYAPSDLHQDATKSYLEYNPEVFVSGATTFRSSWAAVNAYLLSSDPMLTSDKSDPTPDEVMESTRLMAVTSSPSIESDGVHASLICGTEIVVNVHTILFRRVRGTHTVTEYPLDFTGVHQHNTNTYVVRLAQFRWHPTVATWTNTTGTTLSTNSVFGGFFNEFDNVAILNHGRLYDLHEVALMSMLASPSIALLGSVSKSQLDR